MIAYISYFLPSKPAYTSPFSQSASQQAVSKQASSQQAASKQSASSPQAVRKQSASSPQAKCPWNRRTLLSAFAMIVTISTPLWREVMERILWILW